MTELQVNSNDTYTLHTHFEQPRTGQDGKCQDQIPGLEEYENIEIKDKSTEEQFICDITISNQHISRAQKPFVTIQHRGESFLVTLKPIEDLDFLDQESNNFSFTISFPGPILKVDSPVAFETKNHSVEWTDPTVLVRGFEVKGQDHVGMTLASRIWLGVLCLLIIALVTIYFMRKNPRVAPVWNALVRGWRKLWKGAYFLVLRGLEYLDLAHSTKKDEDASAGKHSSRSRKSRRERVKGGKTTSSVKETPSLVETSSVTGGSSSSETLSEPEIPSTPEEPNAPAMPDEREIPSSPEALNVSAIPNEREIPSSPEAPKTPEIPSTSEIPNASVGEAKVQPEAEPDGEQPETSLDLPEDNLLENSLDDREKLRETGSNESSPLPKESDQRSEESFPQIDFGDPDDDFWTKADR